MKISRFVIWAVMAVLFLAACSSRSTSPTGSSASAGALTSTDTGVTATELHIGVVADVNFPLRPGLFQPTVDGVRSWAAHMNESGGLAGRRVVVDFYDSKLNADEWRNSVIQACAHDIAMIGTSALADDNVTDLTNCKIPDLISASSSDAHNGAPNSFRVLHFETHREQVGPAKWYLATFKSNGCCHGVWLDPIDAPAPKAQAEDYRKAQLQLGFTQARVFGVSGREANFTPFALAIKDGNATYVRVGNDYNQTVALRREAKVQGVNSVVVWDCPGQCYNPDFIKTGGADIEGQYVNYSFEPFEEADQYPGLQTYIDAVKKYVPNNPVNSFSLGGWVTGLMFRDAVQKVVSAKGNNGLTRANLLDALRGMHDFTADGIAGKVDIGAKKTDPCFLVMQVRNGKFVRVTPDKGLDCNATNVVNVAP